MAFTNGAPLQAWTLATLAAQVGMSRSAFTARFGALVGAPPMRYLARLRLQLARAQLQQGSDTVTVIAERFGYQSEAAFGRAFRRELGVSPGYVRRRAPG